MASVTSAPCLESTSCLSFPLWAEPLSSWAALSSAVPGMCGQLPGSGQLRVHAPLCVPGPPGSGAGKARWASAAAPSWREACGEERVPAPSSPASDPQSWKSCQLSSPLSFASPLPQMFGKGGELTKGVAGGRGPAQYPACHSGRPQFLYLRKGGSAAGEGGALIDDHPS